MNDLCPPHPLPGLVPDARQMISRVVEQERLARDTYRLRIEAPELACQVVPGQFFMIRQPGVTNPLLGRPFALYDTYLDADGRPAGIDVVYLVVGKMTGLMSGWKVGDAVEIWGPLGNGFPVVAAQHLLMVAGGIGVTPFLAVAREALKIRRYRDREFGNVQSATLCYGVRSRDYLAGLDDFREAGIELHLATDDGSHAHRGFVTELAEQWLLARRASMATGPGSALAAPVTSSALFCCGPERMMQTIAELAARYQIPCWLSLETPMACGFGACFSCVTRVRLPDGDWDYRRVCVEGPIFPAEQLML
ncbi:MAG: dihydroorotate dehydrogenase electron transfer subunit [Planctomycetaceae bacterium]